MTSDSELVVGLRVFLRELIEQAGIRDRERFLARLVVSGMEVIPAADGCGITQTREQAVSSSHATAALIYELDRLQDRLGEGPCVDAALDPPPDGMLYARNLDCDDARRWPRFAPRAVESGVRSMLSVSLLGETDGSCTALNFYSWAPHAFGDDVLLLAGLFAGQAGGLLHGVVQAADLSSALDSRDVIGQAKGILMERFRVSADTAFDMLIHSSQDASMKLNHMAKWLTNEAEERASET